MTKNQEIMGLDDLRSHIVKEFPRLDHKASAYGRQQIETLKSMLDQNDVVAQVKITGSTHKKRMTYVIDLSDKLEPFPPDIDISIVMREDQDSFEKVFGFLQDWWLQHCLGYINTNFDRKGFYADRKHKKAIFIERKFMFNFTMALYTEETFKHNHEVSYNDRIEPMTPEQRENARILRLLLQRNAAYGSWNRGISGIAVDQLAREHGTLQECAEVLRDCSHDKHYRKLFIPGSYDNMLCNVSYHVWGRIKGMANMLLDQGLVKSASLTYDDWADFHPDRIPARLSIACSTATCGREPAKIAGHVRQFTEKLEEDHDSKGGIEHHIIAYQGNFWKPPRTSIFLALDNQAYPASDADEIAHDLEKFLRRFEHHLHLPHSQTRWDYLFRKH